MWDLGSSSTEIAAAEPSIGVFGIGAIEQHGPHLPLCTDWFTAEEITRRVAEDLGALLVPSLPYSMSQCHGPAPGTVWLRPETLAAVVHDVVLSFRVQGIKKVLVINVHGGNLVLETAVQTLNHTYPDMSVAFIFSVWDYAGDFFDSHVGDYHAGERETSFMLALRPDLVKSIPPDYLPTVGYELHDCVYMDRVCPSGLAGFPNVASADKGVRALENMVEGISQAARTMFSTISKLGTESKAAERGDRRTC